MKKSFPVILIIQMVLLLAVGAAFGDVKNNVSNQPFNPSLKAKINLTTCWIPAKDADGNPVTIENYNEDGELIETRTKAKPIIITYAQDSANGAHDVFGAVSRDEGQTWHITNLSESADKSSFTLANGELAYGHCRKPAMQVKGNRIFVTWTSRYAAEGTPRYEIDGDLNGMGINEEDPKHWQQQGDAPEILTGQQSVDYAAMGFSDIGEVPYSAVWICRGVIITGSMLESSVWAEHQVGDIVWFKAERLTSGVRDANQIFPGGAGSAGFAATWQEDPLGLRPGKGEGPGHGWGGATTSNETDIWYSYLTWDDMLKPVVSPVVRGERPGCKVKMSLPVRISDNDDFNDDTGDTAAARPNCFLQPYTINPDAPLCDQKKSAWAIIAYAETRTNPLGKMEPKSPGSPDSGKNAMYHSFEFTKPLEDTTDADANVRMGHILNMQRTDENGNKLWLLDFSGNPILDANGEKMPLYYNCRRPRFIMQGKSAAGDSGTVLLALYKAGIGGCGAGSDVMMRRCVANGPGNPYKYENFQEEVNLSSVTITRKGFAGLRALEWVQTESNLFDKPEDNPLDDARAHRGAIRGDFVIMGYTWTPNQTMALKGYDTYNFYVRRSFDGGQTWTTDPAATVDVEHTEKFYEACSLDTRTVSTYYAPGAFEPAMNVSLLDINQSIVESKELNTVIEPRIVGVPGTITKTDPVTCEKIPTGYAEDKQDTKVFYMTWATKKFFGEEGEEGKVYFSFSRDYGTTLGRWPFETLSGDTSPWVNEAECQIRMTPDGSIFYSAWLEESDAGSDIAFRRILPSEFPVNQPNAPTASIDSPGGDITIATGDSVDFQATVENGVAPFTYEWNFSGAADPAYVEDPGEILFETAGNYAVTFQVTDSYGNSVIESVMITVEESLKAAIFIDGVAVTQTQASVGDTITFQGLATGGQPDYSYDWTMTNVSSGDPGADDDSDVAPPGDGVYPTTNTYTFDSAGTYQIALTVTDSIGSVDTHYVLVSVEEAVSPVVNVDGFVFDADGAPLEDVEVTLDQDAYAAVLEADVYTDAQSAVQQITGLSNLIADTSVQFPLTTRTNAQGFYQFTGLPEGSYIVSVAGGDDFEEPNVGVTLDQNQNQARVTFRKRGDDGCNPPIAGDLDGDCDVDRNDVMTVQQYLNQDADVLPGADIDGDGVITVLDARKIMMMCTCPNCICE